MAGFPIHSVSKFTQILLNNNYTIVIMDALGREIFNAEYNQTSDLVQNIQLDNALSGMYFVTIQSKGAQITKKIIIE